MAITPTATSMNPSPILEPRMHEAISEFPICLQASVALTLSAKSVWHSFNGRKQQWRTERREETQMNWARTEMQTDVLSSDVSLTIVQLWDKTKVFLKTFLFLVRAESLPLTWGVKVNLFFSRRRREYLLQNKVNSLQKCSGDTAASNCKLSWSSLLAEAQTERKSSRFVSTGFCSSGAPGVREQHGRAELVSSLHSLHRVHKKHLIAFRRGSSLLRCSNTMQSLLLSIHFWSDPAGWTEITAAWLAEWTLFN